MQNRDFFFFSGTWNEFSSEAMLYINGNNLGNEGDELLYYFKYESVFCKLYLGVSLKS